MLYIKIVFTSFLETYKMCVGSALTCIASEVSIINYIILVFKYYQL